MKRMIISAAVAVLFAAAIPFANQTVLPAHGESAGAPGSFRRQDPFFTEEQSERGRTVYDIHCAYCHGDRLQGEPSTPLVGKEFLDKWANGGKTVDDLYYITRTQMPYGAAETLTDRQYIDVVAFMLRMNGFRPGEKELPPEREVLRRIAIGAPESAQDRTDGTRGPGMNPGRATGAPSPGFGPTQTELNAAHSNSGDWLLTNHDYGGRQPICCSPAR